jgi:phosphatidylglycerophosphatase C
MAARAEGAAVAAFDVDGTLTRRDCVGPFLVQLGGRRGVACAFRRRPLATLGALGRRDRDELKEILVGAVFAGLDVAEVDEAGRAFAARIFSGGLRADTVARLRWHQRRGDRVVLVSASLGPYLRPLGALLGIDAVLCSDVGREPGRDGSRYGRRLDGANCRGAEKARRLRAWLGEHGSEVDEVWAYGDSAGDVELLAMAAHPVWVGADRLGVVPDEAMETVA